jgi:ABC-type multidrug transport system fused ATPase/permease subunit
MKKIVHGILTILNKKEKAMLYKLIFFDFIIGILDVAFLGFLLLVVNFYTQNKSLPHISFLPSALTAKNSILLLAVFLILFCIKNWFGFIGIKIQHHFFYGVASRLSKRNILNYLNGKYSEFIEVDSSVQIRKISYQPIEFSHHVLTNFQQIISQAILIFFTTCAIIAYHPSLFLLLLLLLVPPVVVLAGFIRKKLKSVRATLVTSGEKNIQRLQESLSGYVESNIYDKNDVFVNRYFNYQQQLNNNIATLQTLESLPPRLIEVFAILGFFILVLINMWSTQRPAIDILTIGIFLAAAYKIIPGIVKILNSAGQIKTYRFTIDNLQSAGTITGPLPAKAAETIRSVKFEEVSFKYNGQEVLSDINFELNPGDFAALTGSSGKGKTTILNLLLGNLTPDKGYISINNQILNAAGLKGYWNKISYVKQQSFFTGDSILKNITLTDERPDWQKLKEVIAFCGIDGMLRLYPEGLDMAIKENGKNISGGQRQRIMLARALYHDFDLLVIDEPFSELDDGAETAILLNLEQLAQQGKIILFITHNSAGLRFSNKIISLNEQFA